MQEILKSTIVREEFSSFIDSVVREKPRVVKRHRDIFLSLSLHHMVEILSTYKLTIEYEQGEDGRFYGSIEQIEDIIGEGDTFEELRENLALNLIEYASDYYANFNRYYNAPNRRSHLPYVLLILIQDNLKEVLKLIA